MRILHVTDTHLGLKVKTWGAPRGYDRQFDCERALAEALEPAMREEVDLVVHSGDVFDRSQPPPQAVEAAATLFERAAKRVPVVIMPGNHDRKGLGGYLREHKHLHIVDEARQVRIKDLVLGVIPFVREAEIWAYDAAQVSDGSDLLVAHQSFDGARVPGFTFRVGRNKETIGPQHLPSRRPDHVLCGHIHPRQVTKIEGVSVVQPGSSERTAFSEEHQTKGYAIWELERKIAWNWVDLESRPMVKVRSEADVQRIGRGTMVQMGKEAPVELVDDVADRGGFFVGRRPRRLPKKRLEQMGMF